ncbi:stage II sporulation protein P [Neobacillus vireti]|nr:stage II sporulation protein P [Neobacillus vireti]
MVLIVFLVISIVVLMDIKVQSKNIHSTISILNTEKILVHILKSENHYFSPEIDEPILSASKMSALALQLAVTIKPTDARTFLGNELPGLRLFDTEIVVAGEGTNLTTLPYESSPPVEVLLEERKVAEEKLAQRNNASDNKPITNPEHKAVFIYHTHSYESFLPLLKDAKNPNDATSNDDRVNVVDLGQRLADNLMRQGIGVDHDKTNMAQKLHDKGWKTSKAYTASREIVEAAAVKNNDLNYFIDIHRDSARRELTTKTINGESFARLYFVVGKENKNYLENLELVKTLNSELEKKYPGISRGIFLKTFKDGNGVYNQDISTKAMLLEIGGIDNNLEELDRTVDVFSEILAEYYWNSKEAKEVNKNG